MLKPLPAIETLLIENNKVLVMPDGWFSTKPEVPYLYLSENPWVCTCSLDYLRQHLDDYGYNVYVRDGPVIVSDDQSVRCDTPARLRGRAVVELEQEDYCDPEREGPTGDFEPEPYYYFYYYYYTYYYNIYYYYYYYSYTHRCYYCSRLWTGTDSLIHPANRHLQDQPRYHDNPPPQRSNDPTNPTRNL
ncbi:uncharacterized protein gp1ba [Aplochiton taeniatus]